MSPTQIPNPQREMPDYVLRCTDSVTLDGLVAVGRFYGPDYLRNRWVVSAFLAIPMRGAGLASAERALARRGYTVERVAV